MIGISFYLNDSLAEERIIQAGEMGVKRAFTSLHIPEESGDLAGRAKKLLQLAKDSGIEVFADVSYHTPAHLGLDDLFALKKLGVTGLRLDDFFDHEHIISLATEFKLAVNASIFFEEDLKKLLNSGLNAEQLIGWHNFYPRAETGLSEAFFTQQNELYKRYNIPISAYIPGAGEKRGPIGEGLPTLEKHRDTDSFLAALELFHSGVDEVYIGDPDHGHGLLEKLMRMASEKTVSLTVEDGFTHGGHYQLRPDLSRDVLRFMNTRTNESVGPKHTVSRPAGSITMDNNNYGRYRGEIQITLRDLPADERVNVIGKLTADDVILLSYLKPGMVIELVSRT
ncbi:MupG family TIM beta-alpha barrel fold protein [Mesobacillus maritimus]|uniref:DUF871 domain-containing protein n=1 Tax=Mesobacillus maritimus TaxID=1643336 RepID=A0ABS7K0T4_9BACI|nr:MupG family TIM beta-alpha barrel fold protein [Mesobacillus maritimus]MBY0095804.1 DUF871 domain-containing protein [Mesobacillus maritimus]